MKTATPGHTDGLSVIPGHFGRSFARNLTWTGLVKWSVQAISWVATIAVARVLTPEDFGLVGMATMFLGLITLFVESGIGITIVTLRELDDAKTGQLNCLSVILGMVGCLLSLAAAEPLGSFFDAPELPQVIGVLSVSFAVTGFKTIPCALLQKELRFRALAVIEGVSGLTAALASILMALHGYGYWALVWPGILNLACSTVLVVSLRSHPFRLPRISELCAELAFTRHQLVSSLAWYTYSNADFLVAGRVLGKAELGVYTFAWTISNTISSRITDLVNRLTPAYFSILQSDAVSLRRYVLRINEGLSVVIFPMLLGIGLLSSDFIPLVLGSQWSGSVVPLCLLLVYTAFNTGTFLVSRVLTARRDTRFLMQMGVLQAIVMPVGFLIGSLWGAGGIAATWLLVFPIVRAPAILRMLRSIDLPLQKYLSAFVPALTGCGVMGVMVLAVRVAIQSWAQMEGRLVICALSGGASYLIVVGLHYRDHLRGVVGLALRKGVARCEG